MKKTFFTILCASTMLIGSNIYAADQAPTPPVPDFEQGMHLKKDFHQKIQKRHQEMDKKLTKDLQLSEEQQKQADEIRKKGRKKMKPLMEKMKEVRQEMDEVRKHNMEEFENILTEEQKTRFEQIKKEHRPDKKFNKKKHGKKHNKKQKKD